MRRILLLVAGAAALFTILASASASTRAAPLAGAIPLTVGDIAPTDYVVGAPQFVWNGQLYCWYPGGWHGDGWYRCGYGWRAGFGWGGGWEWRPVGVVWRGRPWWPRRDGDGWRDRREWDGHRDHHWLDGGHPPYWRAAHPSGWRPHGGPAWRAVAHRPAWHPHGGFHPRFRARPPLRRHR